MQYAITGAQLIGFEESAEGAQTFRTTDPKTGNHTPWKFHEATDNEIDRVMQLARSAFETYKGLAGEKRAAFLRAIAEQLEQQAAILVPAYVLESGLPEGRARGELGRTTGQLRAFAAMAEAGSWMEARIDTAVPDRQPVPKPDIRKCLFPLGPVVVFGASNFPFAFSTAGGDTASALAVGCPVVVKGHPLHAGTGEVVARCIREAATQTGMPEGVFSHLHGSGHDLGEKLVKHPEARGVGFTGSRKGGFALARIGQQRDEPIPVFAEMGSVNPVVVMPSATAPSMGWAAAYAHSVTLGAGQFCTNPGLILGIAGEGWEAFTGMLANEMEKLPASCMLHPGMADHFRDLQTELLSHSGVTALKTSGTAAAGALVGGTVATVSGKEFRKNPVLQQEVFGPFTLAVGCESQEELLEIVRSLEGQLTASVLGNESEIAAIPELLAALQDKVGRLLFNGVPTGVEVCPAMHHGGPFPATTDARYTSVGLDAYRRWVKPIALQNAPAALLPVALRDENPNGIWRTVNGEWTRKSI